jgi:hypothetical protein
MRRSRKIANEPVSEVGRFTPGVSGLGCNYFVRIFDESSLFLSAIKSTVCSTHRSTRPYLIIMADILEGLLHGTS